MSASDLESRFAVAIVEHDLLVPDDTVVVGVSGGVDSVVLLHLLCVLNDSDDWSLRLHVAHLNHQLREKDSDKDAAFVEQLARSLQLPCTVETADVAAELQDVSVEEAGRAARFAFFERVCLTAGAKCVILAHQADDNAETILHRILRGTGMRGLRGIRVRRPIRDGSDVQVVRPLLGIRREEIEAYAQERDIEYRTDASNESADFTRNRIRHTLMPLLREQFNPQIAEALLRLADQAGGLDSYLTETGERLLESLIVEEGGGQLVLHCPTLARKARVLQTHVIRQAILRLGVGERELSYMHLNAVADLAAGRAGSKSIDLPAGLCVARRYDRLILHRPGQDVPQTSSVVPVATDGTTVLADMGAQITAAMVSASEVDIDAYIKNRANRGQEAHEEWLDADQVHTPLLARSRRPGDRFLPLGMSGMKKLSDFFIDEKIDAPRRERTVVLCDQLGPIWIVPFRIDHRVRLTRLTARVLKLNVSPIQPE